MKITKSQAEIMLQKMPEMAEKIYLEYPELKPSMVANNWEDLGKISGYFICEDAKFRETGLGLIIRKENKNVFKAKKQATSSLAYAQLTQLMYDCGDCDVDWMNQNKLKHCIESYRNELRVFRLTSAFSFLAFNTAKIRDEFFQKHEGLIKQFYQL